MRVTMVAALLVAAVGATGTAQAQSALEARVDRLEREMRAVQRKVFPGGSSQYFEPEIAPPTADPAYPGLPASSPVADLTQRITALEGQVATLTGQVEQAQYRVRQVETSFATYRRETDARIKALEDRLALGGDTGSSAAAGDTAATPAPASGGTRGSSTAASTPAESARPAPAAAGSRAQQIAAVERPSDSGDPAEDQYIYGYRLWAAKLYPEARGELEKVVQKYPNHRRASFAQNLLGRAYLDAGAPSLAAVAFYDNFKNNPNGERAPDSLFYLAEALKRLNKPKTEICKVYNELTTLYGDRISDQMKSDVADRKAAVGCR